MKQNPEMWRNKSEQKAVAESERFADSTFLIERYELQARSFAQGKDIQRGNQNALSARARLIKSFINSPDYRLILEQTENKRLLAGADVAKRNPHLLPDIFPVDDLNPYRHKGAFLVALITELQRPEYNQ